MKNLIIPLILFPFIQLFGQGSTLIFRSGFEPYTTTILQRSSSADIIGTDYSVSPPNDWVNDLETHPNIGIFNIQYQGGDSLMRMAQITADPSNPANKALWFWIKSSNVDGRKGRVQANLYNSTNGFSNLYYSIRLFLPHDLDTLKYASPSWFTLMEFWNNPSWDGDPYPFRISMNLQKTGNAPDSFRFQVHGQIETGTQKVWKSVWDTTNKRFDVPIGKWMTIEINYIEGDNTTGKFYMAVTPDGGRKTVVFDLTEYTCHPADPNPDGLTHFNPFKLYTSGAIIDRMRNFGKLVNVFWDDFEMWNDSITTEIEVLSCKDKSFNLYPNPSNGQFFVEMENGNVVIEIFNVFGEKNFLSLISENKSEINSNLPGGIYFYKVHNKIQCISSGKIIVQNPF